MKVILKDMDQEDWLFGIRAAEWLTAQTKKDAIISYGAGKDFYVKRNKASITIRPCNWTQDS